MGFYGMNVNDVRQFAQGMQSAQQDLDNVRTQLQTQIDNISIIWIGPDAEAFQQAWEQTVASLCRSVEDDLRRKTREIQSHADEQDAASDMDESSHASEASGNVSSDEDAPAQEGPGNQDDRAERGKVPPEVATEWAENMTDAQRRKVAQEIVNKEFEKYGLEPIDITFTGMDGNGYWRDFPRKLAINEAKLDDPDILHTLAHEVRHAAQHQAIRDTRWTPWDRDTSDDYQEAEKRYGASKEEIQDWRKNFAPFGYKSAPKYPGDDAPQEKKEEYQKKYKEYYDQPVEVDARKAGREFTNNMTLEDMQQYQRDAGVR